METYRDLLTFALSLTEEQLDKKMFLLGDEFSAKIEDADIAKEDWYTYGDIFIAPESELRQTMDESEDWDEYQQGIAIPKDNPIIWLDKKKGISGRLLQDKIQMLEFRVKELQKDLRKKGVIVMSNPKQRPILFSTEMVKALLAGNKTQTRRTIKPQPDGVTNGKPWIKKFINIDINDELVSTDKNSKGNQIVDLIKCPYGQIGDILWVKETYTVESYSNGTTARELVTHYRSEGETGHHGLQLKWKPSLHMPKKYARIWLKITDIRVEKLQDISETDSIAEGIGVETIQNQIFYTDYLNKGFARPDPRMSYASLWESINGKDSWDANPWVWVITFEKVEKP